MSAKALTVLLMGFGTCKILLEPKDILWELNRQLLKKDDEIGALQLVVAQKEADIQTLRGAAISPAIKLDLAKQELGELQRNIHMSQTKYEEEFFQRLKLQDEIMSLNQHIESLTQSHFKVTQELRARVSQSEALVLQLEEKLRSASRSSPTLTETVQKIQEASEAEMKRMQNQTENIYNQSAVTYLHCSLPVSTPGTPTRGSNCPYRGTPAMPLARRPGCSPAIAALPVTMTTPRPVLHPLPVSAPRDLLDCLGVDGHLPDSCLISHHELPLLPPGNRDSDLGADTGEKLCSYDLPKGRETCLSGTEDPAIAWAPKARGCVHRLLPHDR
ncbi:Hypothetical predicted protein [Pelobates cultripes]|uniref:Uncharacterized protein n=1 Tax=Pelobates cultripes TaxID=61616 RepID=A0AAD1RJ54_PELCU|nr:Hypothetical predicted protein [Pelobates cultripes]